jgi:uncharacterized protein
MLLLGMKNKVIQQIKEDLIHNSLSFYILSGFKQVGKTTAVSHLLRNLGWNYHFAVAESKSNAAFWLDQTVHTAIWKYKQDTSLPFLLVIDNIHKLDKWHSYLLEIEQHIRGLNQFKILFIGTSGNRMRQAMEANNPMSACYRMGQQDLQIIQENFGTSFEKFLYFGAYPGALSFVEEEDLWRKFIQQTIIEQTFSHLIHSQIRVDKPDMLFRLFELCVQYNGQIVALNKLMGELSDAGNTSTLSNYLDILEDVGLVGSIEKFSGDQARVRAAKPKLQLYTTAVLTALQNTSFHDLMFEYKSWFRVVQAGLGAHLLNGAYEQQYELFYWQDGEHYVDFVLQKDNQLIAIELKGEKFGKNKGLELFKQKFKPTKSLLIGTGGISLEEFMAIPPIELF